MKIGISTASFFGKRFTEDTFDVIREIGADTVEVFFATFTEYEEQFARLLLERKGDINVRSIHALTNQYEPELFNMSPRTRGDAYHWADRVLSNGEILGAKYYTFHGATLLKRIKYVFNYDDLGAKVNDIIDLCESHGIELCYENVHWAYFSTPEYFRNLRDRCPRLRTCLDIKQAMQSHIDYREFIKVMEGRISNVHLCDYFDDGKLAMPGKGTVDFVELFRMLRDYGYDDTALLEVYSRDYNEFSELKDSYEYLLECADKA